VSVINADTREVTATIAVGHGPASVSVDPETDTVYAANSGSNTVSVINADTREVTATIAVGHGPASVSVDPETDTVYAANSGSDTVSVIGVPLSHARHNGIAITVPGLPRVQH
jgi:YVTN family beta-propeller protein